MGNGAPMLSYGVTSHMNNYNLMRETLENRGQGGMALIAQIIKCWNSVLPDIFVAYEEKDLDVIDTDTLRNTRNLTSTIFHELAHVSHCSEVTPQYWAKYVDEIVYNWATGVSDVYGSMANSPYCGVGEMWAGYYEEILMLRYYNDSLSLYLGNCFKLDIGDWIRPQMLLNIAKQLDLEPYEIFASLFPSNVTEGVVDSIEEVRDNLIDYCGGIPSSQATKEINYAFDCFYGDFAFVHKFYNTSPMARFLKYRLTDNPSVEVTKFVDFYSSVVLDSDTLHYCLSPSAPPIVRTYLWENMAVYDTNVMNMSLVSYSPNNVYGTNHFFDNNSWNFSIDTLNKQYIYSYETDY